MFLYLVLRLMLTIKVYGTCVTTFIFVFIFQLFQFILGLFIIFFSILAKLIWEALLKKGSLKARAKKRPKYKKK